MSARRVKLHVTIIADGRLILGQWETEVELTPTAVVCVNDRGNYGGPTPPRAIIITGEGRIQATVVVTDVATAVPS